MKRRVLTLALLVLLLGAAAALAQTPDTGVAIDDPGLDRATIAKLIANGELLIVRETPAGKLQMITSGILIDKPVADVYQTVTDYAHYTEFMPSTEKCEVVGGSDNVKDIKYEIKFKFLIFSFTMEYVLRTTLNPPNGVSWTLLSSEGNRLKKSVGSWRLLPVNGGQQTAAFYSVYTDISNAVPGMASVVKKNPSMEAAINVSTCIMVLQAIKKRAENPGWKQPK